MLAALAVAKMIGNQDGAAEVGPGDAHVLKLALGFGEVVAVGEEDAGHFCSGWCGGEIEVSGDEQARARFVENVLDGVAFALEFAGDLDFKIARYAWELAEGIAEG